MPVPVQREPIAENGGVDVNYRESTVDTCVVQNIKSTINTSLFSKRSHVLMLHTPYQEVLGRVYGSQDSSFVTFVYYRTQGIWFHQTDLVKSVVGKHCFVLGSTLSSSGQQQEENDTMPSITVVLGAGGAQPKK